MTADTDSDSHEEEAHKQLQWRRNEVKDDIYDHVLKADNEDLGWAEAERLVKFLIDGVCIARLSKDDVEPGETGWGLRSTSLIIDMLLINEPESGVLAYDQEKTVAVSAINLEYGTRRHAKLAAAPVSAFMQDVQAWGGDVETGLDMLGEHWDLDIQLVK